MQQRNIDYAFPPFAPGLPSVYERAGFGVNRSGSRSPSAKSSTSSFGSQKSKGSANSPKGFGGSKPYGNNYGSSESLKASSLSSVGSEGPLPKPYLPGLGISRPSSPLKQSVTKDSEPLNVAKRSQPQVERKAVPPAVIVTTPSMSSTKPDSSPAPELPEIPFRDPLDTPQLNTESPPGSPSVNDSCRASDAGTDMEEVSDTTAEDIAQRLNSLEASYADLANVTSGSSSSQSSSSANSNALDPNNMNTSQLSFEFGTPPPSSTSALNARNSTQNHLTVSDQDLNRLSTTSSVYSSAPTPRINSMNPGAGSWSAMPSTSAFRESRWALYNRRARDSTKDPLEPPLRDNLSIKSPALPEAEETEPAQDDTSKNLEVEKEKEVPGSPVSPADQKKTLTIDTTKSRDPLGINIPQPDDCRNSPSPENSLVMPVSPPESRPASPFEEVLPLQTGARKEARKDYQQPKVQPLAQRRKRSHDHTHPHPPERNNGHGHTHSHKRKVCRGCLEPIVGKSMRSKDGTLNGRWHRQCFRCTRCADPLSNEVYVLEDQPFCQHCYHVVNKSVCRMCGGGVEGECLETRSDSGDDKARPTLYHIDCLKCVECQVQLHHSYFDIGGSTLCAEHAFKVLPPDAQYERRYTRFVMI